MKYKVGDKVRVKSLDWYNANKNKGGFIKGNEETFVDEMSKLCGEIVTIEYIRNSKFYIIKEDKNKYSWEDWMFEEIMKDEVKIEVPEGYVIDKENSTFECIKFKKKEPEVEISKCGDSVKIKTSEHIFYILDKEDLKTNFDSAFKLAKIYDCGATIPTREQWKIIYEHLDEINSLLKNKIEKDYYWTSEKEDSYPYHSWNVTMFTGSSYSTGRSYAYRVRPIKNYRLS